MRSRNILAGIAAVGILAGIACSGVDTPAEPTPAATAGAVQDEATPPEATSETQASVPDTTEAMSVADLVQLAEPAIVRIAVGGGVGTGFIVDEAGFIITNNHVIESAAQNSGVAIEVTMFDGAVLEADLVGTDPRADIALLKIDGGDLHALPLGSLDEVVVGQDVVAIGFPLDLQGGDGSGFTVTRGIVSAKNRAINEGATIFGAIQTDAPITNGNSGGPLLNLQGEVIGVNTAIALNRVVGGAASGIGFAVGADSVAAVYEELRAHGEVKRALLGILGFSSVRPAQARELRIPEELGGIEIGTAQPSGPVGSAGIEHGDVIVRIGEFAVSNESDLAEALIVLDPGDEVAVVVYRNGEEMTFTVTLGDASEQ